MKLNQHLKLKIGKNMISWLRMFMMPQEVASILSEGWHHHSSSSCAYNEVANVQEIQQPHTPGRSIHYITPGWITTPTDILVKNKLEQLHLQSSEFLWLVVNVIEYFICKQILVSSIFAFTSNIFVLYPRVHTHFIEFLYIKYNCFNNLILFLY